MLEHDVWLRYKNDSVWFFYKVLQSQSETDAIRYMKDHARNGYSVMLLEPGESQLMFSAMLSRIENGERELELYDLKGMFRAHE